MDVSFESPVSPAWLSDESHRAGRAQAIAFPRDTEGAAKAVTLARRSGHAVVVQGARTGLCGGGVPCGEAVINLSRMNRPLAFCWDGGGEASLTVQAGVTLEQVRQLLYAKEAPAEWFEGAGRADWERYCKSDTVLAFLPNPSETGATLGGMAACDAAGMLEGSLADHLSALTWVRADGGIDAFRQGETFSAAWLEGVPGAAGRSPIELFLGSEGTLGVVTELTLRLFPAAPQRQSLWIPFESARAMFAFYRSVERYFSPPEPLLFSAECYDHSALELLSKAPGGALGPLPLPPTSRAALVLELNAPDEDAFFRALEIVLAGVNRCGADEEQVCVASEGGQVALLAKLRHKLVETAAAQAVRLPILPADVAVPNGALEDVYALLSSTLKPGGVLFGRLDRGLLNAWLFPDGDRPGEAEAAYAAWLDGLRKAGCACSHEFSIGRAKKELLAALSPETAAERRLLRRALDPEALFNRGVLTD